MRTRRLGSSNLTVGSIGLGCMGMTWAYVDAPTDRAESIAVIHRALELGSTLIDTADMYGPFTNEELVGEALQKGHRDRAVLATKCGLVVNPETGQPRPNGHPDHVRAAVDASLTRLRTDVIDLYQLHRVDPNVPIEETWGVMAEHVQAGKVKAIGMSEASLDQLQRAHTVHPVATLQSELSLWTRGVLREVLPWCDANDVGFIPFSPLGRGFLTGKFAAGTEFAKGDFRSRNPRFTADAVDANQAIVNKVRALATRKNCTPGQVALAWTLAQGGMVVPIPGTKRRAYLDENCAADAVELSAEDLAELDALPEAVGSRY
jgi:aryl-alcohol dehydrogenase-like predicted oxidoreductase